MSEEIKSTEAEEKAAKTTEEKPAAAPAAETTNKPAETAAPAAATTDKPAEATAPAAATTDKPAGTTAPAASTPRPAGQRSDQRPGQGGPRRDGPGGPRRDGGRPQRRDGQRMPRFRRKVCRFCHDKAAVIDYKKIDVLESFITDRGKILPRRVTGTCAKHQRTVAREIKRARIIALLPFVEK